MLTHLCRALKFFLLFLALCTPHVQAQQKRISRVPKPDGMMALAMTSAVQKELEIEPSSPLSAAILELAEAMSTELAQAVQRPNRVQETDDDGGEGKAKKRVPEIRREYEGKLRELLNDQQFLRLSQIHWQSLGPFALRELTVQESIGLTDNQKQEVAKVYKQYRDSQLKRLDEYREKKMDQSGYIAATRMDLQILENGIDAILSTTQKQMFSEIKGRIFDFSGDVKSATHNGL